MKLNELTTPFESFSVITYNADRTKALCKNKQMQLIAGSIYRGQTIKEEYNDYCDVYICYAGIPVGIWIDSVHVDYSIEEVMARIKRRGMETLENYMAAIKYRLEKQDYFRFTEIEFIKHIAPELENQMLESKKAFAENQDKKRIEQAAQREAEDRAFVAERNAEAEQIVNKALDILRNGGRLLNREITIYKTANDGSSYFILNYLARKYGVNIPIKTQGWINSALMEITVSDGRMTEGRILKGKNSSTTIWKYMNQLIAAVIAES